MNNKREEHLKRVIRRFENKHNNDCKELQEYEKKPFQSKYFIITPTLFAESTLHQPEEFLYDVLEKETGITYSVQHMGTTASYMQNSWIIMEREL